MPTSALRRRYDRAVRRDKRTSWGGTDWNERLYYNVQPGIAGVALNPSRYSEAQRVRMIAKAKLAVRQMLAQNKPRGAGTGGARAYRNMQRMAESLQSLITKAEIHEVAAM